MSILTSRVEQFDFSFQPSIDRKVVREFSVPLPSVLTTVGHRCSSARHSTRALPPWLALVPEEFCLALTALEAVFSLVSHPLLD